MIKTNDLKEYVLLSVLKNFCEATINDSDCSECKLNAVCDYGLGDKPILFSRFCELVEKDLGREKVTYLLFLANTKAMKKMDIKYEPDVKEEDDIDPKKDAEAKQ